MEKRDLYRITCPGFCFGVIVDEKGVIVRSGIPAFVGLLLGDARFAHFGGPGVKVEKLGG